MSVWKSTMGLQVRIIDSQSIKKPAVMWLAGRRFMLALTLFMFALALALTLKLYSYSCSCSYSYSGSDR